METNAPNLKGMEARLKELAAKIDELETKVHESHSDIKTQMKRFEALHGKRKTAHEILEQIEESKDEEVKALKSGWEEIVTDMQELLDKIASSC